MTEFRPLWTVLPDQRAPVINLPKTKATKSSTGMKPAHFRHVYSEKIGLMKEREVLYFLDKQSNTAMHLCSLKERIWIGIKCNT